MNHPPRKRDDMMDRRDAFRTAFIVSGLFWGLLVVITNSDAKFLGKLRGILGDEPNGLRFDLSLLLVTFQLALPMVFFLYHTLLALTYAKRYEGTMLHTGDVGTAIGLIGDLLKDTGEGPVIRRSKLIAFAGIIYLIGIVAWWIWWTDKHGI
ncbi:MAG: hypothetical protein ACYC7L_12930 [Nitrospirota bacterium]